MDRRNHKKKASKGNQIRKIVTMIMVVRMSQRILMVRSSFIELALNIF